MAVIVAVDGGGSRCRLVAYSEGGEVLARTTVDEHASLSLGVAAAWQHIVGGLNVLRQKMRVAASWQPDKLVMGLAGSLQQRRRSEFLSLLPGSVSATLVTDGYAQLMGASGGQAGICLAIGTGSVLHWQDDQGRTGMAGGWGFPIGDEASGAWIGMRLVQRYIWHWDGHPETSSLFDCLKSRVGDTVSDIQQWTTESRSSVLAQLAPLVFEHASNGDAVAMKLLDEACEHAVALVNLVDEQLPLYVVGGVGKQLEPRLRHCFGDRLSKPKGDALRGLWLLALADRNQGPPDRYLE